MSGLVAGDVVTTGATGRFVDRNAGNGKTIQLAVTHGGADAANYTFMDQASTTASITPKSVSVTGLRPANKVYDGTRATSLSGGTLSGLVGTETLAVTGGSGTFADQNAGTNKIVTVSGMSLANGTGLAANYMLTQPAALTADITPRALTLTGITVADKVYDGSAAATLSGGALSGLVAGETLTLGSLTGAFSDKNVGTSKAVTLATVALNDGSGRASNYAFAQPSAVTASITPKALTVSGITAADKVYDGTTATTVSTSGAVLTGLVAGDAVTTSASGTFTDKNAATGKTVTLASTHGGADAANYVFTDQATATAAITRKALALSGVTVADKTADGTTRATVTGQGVLSGALPNDSVGLDASALSARFAQSTPGAGIAVAVSGLALSGSDAGNYTLPGTATASGTIRPAANPAATTTVATPVTIAPQAVGTMSSLATPAVGGLSYVPVADMAVASATGTSAPVAAAAPATTTELAALAGTGDGQGNATAAEPGAGEQAPSAAPRRRANQAAGTNRDVKYLDVMVVSGGIRMPAPNATNNDKAAQSK